VGWLRGVGNRGTGPPRGSADITAPVTGRGTPERAAVRQLHISTPLAGREGHSTRCAGISLKPRSRPLPRTTGIHLGGGRKGPCAQTTRSTPGSHDVLPPVFTGTSGIPRLGIEDPAPLGLPSGRGWRGTVAAARDQGRHDTRAAVLPRSGGAGCGPPLATTAKVGGSRAIGGLASLHAKTGACRCRGCDRHDCAGRVLV
jgi:hypothetical protein